MPDSVRAPIKTNLPWSVAAVAGALNAHHASKGAEADEGTHEDIGGVSFDSTHLRLMVSCPIPTQPRLKMPGRTNTILWAMEADRESERFPGGADSMDEEWTALSRWVAMGPMPQLLCSTSICFYAVFREIYIIATQPVTTLPLHHRHWLQQQP
ncbi:hypothetical protein P280DRAFT_484783 [Massarina eburnea CBS 473.64]|uniref:Uncharacterized protein n=1 Tax=Massarina eburnea CBS 473.64 TaxID=1395130 RepID=A0A6A6RJD8_9PLEO|nr:hypothetical protein P280DRAFT_484783 [Massarina eburnea CBS 473.64]